MSGRTEAEAGVGREGSGAAGPLFSGRIVYA